MHTSFPPPETLLPHAPPMVLLDSITECSDEHILCQAQSHLSPDNPLRVEGELSVYAAVEYAAQAMAAHARLTGDQSSGPRKGVIAVASKLCAETLRLDDLPGVLIIRADILARNADSSLCAFTVSANEQLLLSGQLTAVTREPDA